MTPLFDEVFFRHASEAGVPEAEIQERDSSSKGSSDVGNVSQVIPTIQPTVSIADEYIAGHSEEFKAAARSTKGLASIGIAAELWPPRHWIYCKIQNFWRRLRNSIKSAAKATKPRLLPVDKVP